MSAREVTDARLRVAIGVAALVSVVAALLFPLAPVSRPEVTYAWPDDPSPTAAAIPLLPYQPVTLDAAVDCDAARATRGTLLATLPPTPDPTTEPLAGLQVVSDGVAVTVATAGTVLTTTPLPAGPCALRVHSETAATTATLTTPAGAREVARTAGDLRPSVAGAFTAAASSSGLSLAVVADTRFQTSPTPLKVAVGVVALLGLAVALAGLVRLDRRARPRRTSRAPRAPDRAGLVADAGVVVTLAVWTLIGPVTVDDGYIAGIVRSRGTSGQTGTVYRWLNSPEAPFGWFYDVLHGIAVLDPDPLWLRLPSSVLGVVAWMILRRGLLPRLRVLATAATRWWWPLVAAVVFLGWWLPWNLSVRPEPWVAVGTLAVVLLTERALARRAVVPAVVAVAIAGATLAVTPTGLIAFAPLLAALVPLARLLRGRRDVGLPAALAAALAALGVTALLAFGDQTWASVRDSVAIRTLVGGDLPWTDEYERYASLLTAGAADGNLGKRVAVLTMLVALGALGLAVPRARGVARGAARRLALLTGLSLVLLALTPTKWTHHFGAFAGIGTAVVVVALRVWAAPDPEPDRALRRAAAGTAVVALAGGTALAGWNQWHWITNVDITWSTLAPQLGGVRFSDAALVGGGAVVAVLAAAIVRRALVPAWRPPGVRRVAGLPGALVVALVAGVVALEVLSFACSAVARRDSYTLASDSVAALTGRSCGLADDLLAEPDPTAGVLPALAGSEAASASGFAPLTGTPADDLAPAPGGAGVPLALAGRDLPGWRAVDRGIGAPATVRTAWSALPPPSATGPEPLVVTVSGPTDSRTHLAAEFGVAGPGGVRTVATLPLSPAAGVAAATDEFAALAPAARDLRIDAEATAPGATAVRLVAVDGGERGRPVLAFSTPRVPRTVPLGTVLPPGVPAAYDWPTAFLFPCTPFSPLRDGLAPVPGWRLADPAADEARAGYISYTASQGGPWTTARLLVRQERVPVYLRGLDLTDVIGLYRWVPVVPLVPPRREEQTVVEAGWSTPGPLAVGRP